MTLIRLAANPYSQEADTSMPTNTAVQKGRQVNGPRTKLAAAPASKADVVSLARMVRANQEATLSLARSVQALAKARISKDVMYQDDDMMAVPPVEDEEQAPGMDGQPEFPEEQEQDPMLAMAEDFDSDFDPYGDTDDAGGEYNADEDTENELGIHDGELTKARRVAKARVRKDDAASSFGEKDEDIVGNRQNVPDDKGKDAEEYLIQGGPGDGPGPVSKALVRKAVQAELARMGIVRKAAPGATRVPASTVNKAETDEWALFEQLKGRSFHDIARLRTEVGDLPAGPL